MNRRLSAGSNVETRCTRCREVLNHTIVAMVGEKIVRVECNTCHGIHAFHPVKTPKEAEAKAAPQKGGAPRKTIAKPKADQDAVVRAEWEALQHGIDPAQAIPYDMTRKYSVKNLLLHPSFGLGIVQAVLPPNKIEVIFESGKKRLRAG